MASKLRYRIHTIIFESNTRGGKLFEVLLIFAILISIAVVIFDSIPDLKERTHALLYSIEWIITFIFSAEYLLRVFSARKPLRYIFSFYGMIDLLATIPSYIGLIVTGGSSLLVIRALRLLRVFRVLKLSRYTTAGYVLRKALSLSRAKIGVFLTAVFTVVIVIGTIMYLVEGEAGGFTSIPKGVYWTIVTITTVGYGDIAPITPLGQFIASLTMLTGYAIIAVPTGIVTAEITQQQRLIRKGVLNTLTCNECLDDDHDNEAKFCKRCGASID